MMVMMDDDEKNVLVLKIMDMSRPYAILAHRGLNVRAEASEHRRGGSLDLSSLWIRRYNGET